MVTARHAMLAALRGRLDEVTRLTQEVAEASRKAGMADAAAITGTLGGLVLAERGTAAEAEAAVAFLLGAAVRQPGHLYEATAARIMAEIGRTAEAAAELDRLLPRVLAASGPRWVGVLADLALVAARTGQSDAAIRLAQALAPYRAGSWCGAAPTARGDRCRITSGCSPMRPARTRRRSGISRKPSNSRSRSARCPT
jgi:ATP/maltotriose-dependent transcriptional regulator MalT